MSDRRAPLIGITSYAREGVPPGFAVPCGYVDAVRRAGGMPVGLLPGDPAPERTLDVVDGVILIGGGDIHPDEYGGGDHDTLYSVCTERDAFDLRITHAALARQDRPILSICRGMQVLNVACGGDLIADIPACVDRPIVHRVLPKSPTNHSARIDPSSRLAEILERTDVHVRSWHHQAVGELGNGLKPVAWAEDGVVEALEHRTHAWCIAVQWHPELQLDDEVQQRLFQTFVSACRSGQP